jgi:hypothetical protein
MARPDHRAAAERLRSLVESGALDDTLRAHNVRVMVVFGSAVRAPSAVGQGFDRWVQQIATRLAT